MELKHDMRFSQSFVAMANRDGDTVSSENNALKNQTKNISKHVDMRTRITYTILEIQPVMLSAIKAPQLL